jgi:hypothetical protein
MKIFSEISSWWIVPICLVSFALAAYYYFWNASKSPISLTVRRLLFVVRGSVLTVLGVLLLGIIYQSTAYRKELPIVYIVVDDSESMLNYADSTVVKTELSNQVKRLKTELQDRFVCKELSFSSLVTDSIDYSFKGVSSNLGLPFTYIRDVYFNNNNGGIVFVSDGNFNEGIHPSYEAKKLDFVPVYAVAIGDTITKKDAMIHAVIANQIAFSGNVFPVKVEVKASRMKGVEGIVRVSRNAVVVDEQPLLFKNDNDQQQLLFQIEAKDFGIQSYTFELITKEKEHTLSNNVHTLHIEVLKSKRRIAMISGGLHPDLGAIRSVLEKDKNTVVQSFLAKDLKQLPEADLVIYHNPGSPFMPVLWKQLNESKIPFLAILSGNTDVNTLGLGISGHTAGRTDYVQLAVNPSFQLIRFSEEFQRRAVHFPPLQVPYSKSIQQIGDALFVQKVGAVTTEKPLFTFFEKGGKKSAVLYGTGIWQWKLNEFNRYQDNQAFDELWSKVLQYLTVKQNTDKLRVFPPISLHEHKDAVFRAEFYNDAFQQIVEPELKLELFDSEKKKLATYTFQTRENDYHLALGRLKAGAYSWKVSTEFLTKQYEKRGDFIVASTSQEAKSLTANYEVLQQLARGSSGAFFKQSEWDLLIETIQQNENITSVQYEELSFDDLIDYKWLFFLLVLLLSIEWAVRRWSGAS